MRTIALLALIALAGAEPAIAQAAGWDARLAISPFPSPYLSDWESNPSIGTLTITNPTGTDRNVLLAYRVTDQGGHLLASGRSNPLLIPAGPPTVLSDFVNLPGSSQHDQTLEDRMRRTGRLPEGENTTCVAVTDAGGFVMAEDCATFSIVYPDPPYLIGPLDEAALASGFPILQWTPMQVPPAFHLTYLVRVSEVLAGQTPLQALVANIPVFEATTNSTSLEYPIGATPLVEGKSYAWRVQALDQNGYAASSNDGRSEVWTFRFDVRREAPAPRPLAFALFNAYDANTQRDADPADGGVTSAPQAQTSYAFNEICDNWSAPPPDRIELGVNAPFGFMGFQADHASLYRQLNASDPAAPNKWWVFARTARGRAVLIHGNCRDRLLGGFQWIASRKLGRNQNINEYLGTHAIGSVVESVEYGVWVVALHGGTVTVPAEFREGSEFLAGHDVEVQRGLNAYLEVNLQEHRLWELFQALGYHENRITLQGFVGLDVSRAVGVGLGDSYEASVSQERSFLLLSAALPERVPFGPLAGIATSMRLSFEFEIQDSTGVNVTRDSGGVDSKTKRSLDFIFRIKHTINLRDDLFRRPGEGSRALVGWIGADIAGEREQRTRDVAQRGIQTLNRAGRFLTRGRADGSGPVGRFFGATGVACAPAPDRQWKTDFVINYGLEGQLYLGSLFFEDPAIEIHVGPKAANGQRDLSFAIVSHIGFEGYEQRGIVGISRVRQYPDDPAPDDPACRTMRPRSSTVVDNATSRPRSDANADLTTAPGTPTLPPSTAPGPLHSPWHWEWKVAWDVIPAGALASGVNGALGGLFILLGLGGT